jgi:hypothetical protein
MVIVRTIDGQRYHIPENDEDEALLLVQAYGVLDNYILMIEVSHEAHN